ncbi:MAG: ABC transporter ATP-binding protein, partial [Gammaproteobacteria bacterium]|nr:ABC transporter ATP-binding protein [Gammaproteobacteria bacterium]
LVFEGQGKVIEYVGGYDDWLRQRPSRAEVQRVRLNSNSEKSQNLESRTSKLSYKDQRELDSLPQRIEALESELDKIRDQMSETDFYRQDSTEIAAAKQHLAATEEALAEAYHRWELLERND